MVVLVFLAFVFRLLQRKATSQCLLYSAILLIWLASTPWVVLLGAEKLLSNAVIEIPYEDLPKSDAIVVYSWLKPFKSESKELQRYWTQPLFHVAQLYKSHQTPVIIASSEFPSQPKPVIGEITFARSLLQRFGVPNKDIHILPDTPSTRESAIAIKNKLRSLGSKKVILIASDIRMPRKYLSLKRLFHDKDEIIYPFSNAKAKQAFASPTFELKQWLPDVGYLKITTAVLHDWLGLIIYRLLGWA